MIKSTQQANWSDPYILRLVDPPSGWRFRADAISGYHLWSEKYDREIKDFFQILDEVTLKVVIALQAELTHGEQVRRWYGTTSFEAWGYIVKGLSLFETYTKGNNQSARELFEQALKVDPDSAFAWIMLSWTYVIDVRMGYTKSYSEYLAQAAQIASKAQTIDDKLPEIHSLWNSIYLFKRQYERAIEEGRKSIELGPNSAVNYLLFAQTMFYAGNFDDAVVLSEQAIRLSPHAPVWYLEWLARSNRQVGRYEDSLKIYKIMLDRAAKGEYPVWGCYANLAFVYAKIGQIEKAKINLAKALELNPNYNIEYLRKVYFFKDPAHTEDIINTMRGIGLK